MASRLDRLFVLLESGSSTVTRRAAAQQLGEIQRLRPRELHRLLSRVFSLLRSPTWETRIAAAQAFEAILKNVPQWNPPPYAHKVEKDTFEKNDMGRLRFEKFDIEKVLSQGVHLMGSEGKEYDLEDTFVSSHDLREKLIRQRQLLNARLGLDVASKLGMDMTDIFSNEDLIENQPKTEDVAMQKCIQDQKKSLCELIPLDPKLSSREINRAKRKARQQKIPGNDDVTHLNDEPEKKKVKSETFKLEDSPSILGEWVPNSDGTWGIEAEWWPLEGWASALAADLFNVQWEIRHGAATALRELLKIHGECAGRECGVSLDEINNMHQLWLEDISLRLLCVLALDRFGDFVSDQVVAPVRETCAQCLGIATSLLGPDGISHVASYLKTLCNQPHWEARHGALLGFKYLLAVQQEFGKELSVFPIVIRGLWDPVEDVSAAAASALTPVTCSLIADVPSIIPVMVARLRQLLLAQDELAAACGCYMTLLAAILAEPDINSILGSKYMPSVIVRLWPYLSHPTSSVRKSVLQTLETLTKCPKVIYKSLECNKNDDSITENEKSSHLNYNNITTMEESLSVLDINKEEIHNLYEEDLQWNAILLQDTLRHIFQRALVEHIQDIKNMIERVWINLVNLSSLELLLHAACPFISTWICLAMQPARVAFDTSQLIHSKFVPANNHLTNNVVVDDRSVQSNGTLLTQKWFIGGSETTSATIRENNVVMTRCMASRMIGVLSCHIIKPAPGIIYTPEIEKPVDCYVKVLLAYLSSKSALQRFIVGLIISHWAKLDPNIKPCPSELSAKLHECLSQPIYFDEITIACTRILQDTRDFIAMMRHYKIQISDEYNNVINLENVIYLINDSEEFISKSKLKPKVSQLLEDRRKNILSAAVQCSQEQNSYNISTLAALAGACANLKTFPDKLNPVIKPLMESIKKEDNEQLQQLAADNLAVLLAQCTERQPCPNTKVLNNLSMFLCSDPDFTPKIVEIENEHEHNDTKSSKNTHSNEITDNDKNGILTLSLQLKNIERAALRRFNSTNNPHTSRGPGRPPLTDIPLDELFPPEDESYKQIRIQRRGATNAFISLTSHFSQELPEKLPKLWEYINMPLKNFPEHFTAKSANEIISSLQVLEVVTPYIHKTLLPQILTSLHTLTNLVQNTYKAVRHMASRCIAVLAAIDAPAVMEVIVQKVIPMLGAIDCDTKRQGAAEVLACIIDKLQLNIVPYSVLLVVPLLGRMSDHDEAVRLMCTHCFATLVQLMPLDGAIKENSVLSKELQNQRVKDHQFLEQLFNPKSIGDYRIPVPIATQLRCYQQAGVNWLAFLNKYKLHGVLCDDMGLGKTLQSICMIAGDHYYREEAYKKTKSPDCAPLPSIVICPPTLTGHWVYEVGKFLPNKYIQPLHYMGPPIERERLRCKVKNHNLIVASYDIVRKDIYFFNSIKWNYCILDEGHVVKNGKTKASKAIKTLVANHRLILSGTPIQNNVLELWSLFDFLMPGFLGTERQFTARYSRPILAARDPKATLQHQEAGALAMEALHRQVLPFLLRRIKEDVLEELPPKITQDYYCDLSPLQKKIYEDFSRAHMPDSLDGDKANRQHIFQALRYLQSVCNHPKLVLTPKHPEYVRITRELSEEGSDLHDIRHSAKLPALRQLLLDCGIGSDSSDAPVLSQHRALIFCQSKGMLEVVENDLLKALMPRVSYLRLDGTVPPGQRQSVVARFNDDPSVDVLLLTAQVGGLGLNLTGADTVIFVEHDWNPMKDLQAMDRAHRIGQKRVVNVYRLITRGTLEEKIMGLQKFKLHTANTVISGENSSLDTMGTDKLLELFPGSGLTDTTKGGKRSGDGSGMASLIETLPDLWGDEQYESEYDVGAFVRGLGPERS